MCSNFVKYGRQEIGEIVPCLPDRAQNLAGPAQDNVLRCTRFHFIQIGLLSAELAERVNTAKTRRKANPIFG